jgi:general secretion pathway protein C
VASRPVVSAPGVDIGAILNAHLFGQPPASAVDPAAAPVTAANLVLVGTMAGADPEHGWAILGENPQSVRVVETGAALAGGTVLRAVYPDRVVIERNGRAESVMLPRLSGGAAPYPLRAASSDAGAMIDAVRQAIGSPAAVARVGEAVRPQPVFANGSLRGVRAYPGTNRQAFATLGLQPGDLVTAINGAQLDDVQRATGTLRNLGREPVQLTVERNGQARQISVDPAAVTQNLADDAADRDDEPPIGEP